MDRRRTGRSFWQPDGKMAVLGVPAEEWPNVLYVAPPAATLSVWRQEMKSQKQAILQGNRRPLNGHRYPDRKKIPPHKPRLNALVTWNSSLTDRLSSEVHGLSQPFSNNVVRHVN